MMQKLLNVTSLVKQCFTENRSAFKKACVAYLSMRCLWVQIQPLTYPDDPGTGNEERPFENKVKKAAFNLVIQNILQIK